MSKSPFFTSDGYPSVALCSALASTKTRDINDLLRHVRRAPRKRLMQVALQRGVGAKFMKALRRAVERNRPFVGRGMGRSLKVTMQHIRTGRTITAPSLAAFTRRARLKFPAQFHFDPVFKGQKLTLHGWGLPEVLNQRLDIKDVFGNRYAGTVAELRQHLSGYTLNRLRKGRLVGSLAPASHDYGEVLPSKTDIATEYAVKRRGRVYRGATLDQAGRRAGISSHGVFELTHGRRASVKGVRFHGVKTRRRQDPLAAQLTPIA